MHVLTAFSWKGLYHHWMSIIVIFADSSGKIVMLIVLLWRFGCFLFIKSMIRFLSFWLFVVFLLLKVVFTFKILRKVVKPPGCWNSHVTQWHVVMPFLKLPWSFSDNLFASSIPQVGCIISKDLNTYSSLNLHWPVGFLPPCHLVGGRWLFWPGAIRMKCKFYTNLVVWVSFRLYIRIHAYI